MYVCVSVCRYTRNTEVHTNTHYGHQNWGLRLMESTHASGARYKRLRICSGTEYAKSVFLCVHVCGEVERKCIKIFTRWKH